MSESDEVNSATDATEENPPRVKPLDLLTATDPDEVDEQNQLAPNKTLAPVANEENLRLEKELTQARQSLEELDDEVQQSRELIRVCRNLNHTNTPLAELPNAVLRWQNDSKQLHKFLEVCRDYTNEDVTAIFLRDTFSRAKLYDQARADQIKAVADKDAAEAKTAEEVKKAKELAGFWKKCLIFTSIAFVVCVLVVGGIQWVNSGWFSSFGSARVINDIDDE